MNVLMAMMETTNALTQPTPRISSSSLVKDRPNLSTLIRLAPAIVGTARKKLNSDAAAREQPIRMPPRIVAPERLVPGTSEST